MYDAKQKKRELEKAIELLKDQVKNLEIYKKSLVRQIVILNNLAKQKSSDLKKLTQDLNNFKDKMRSLHRLTGEV